MPYKVLEDFVVCELFSILWYIDDYRFLMREWNAPIWTASYWFCSDRSRCQYDFDCIDMFCHRNHQGIGNRTSVNPCDRRRERKSHCFHKDYWFVDKSNGLSSISNQIYSMGKHKSTARDTVTRMNMNNYVECDSVHRSILVDIGKSTSSAYLSISHIDRDDRKLMGMISVESSVCLELIFE